MNEIKPKVKIIEGVDEVKEYYYSINQLWIFHHFG